MAHEAHNEPFQTGTNSPERVLHRGQERNYRTLAHLNRHFYGFLLKNALN